MCVCVWCDAWRKELGYRVVCEQVSHHPPVSAFHAESQHFTIRGCIHPKLKFWAKSIEVTPKGVVTLHLFRYLPPSLSSVQRIENQGPDLQTFLGHTCELNSYKKAYKKVTNVLIYKELKKNLAKSDDINLRMNYEIPKNLCTSGPTLVNTVLRHRVSPTLSWCLFLLESAALRNWYFSSCSEELGKN